MSTLLPCPAHGDAYWPECLSCRKREAAALRSRVEELEGVRKAAERAVREWADTPTNQRANRAMHALRAALRGEEGSP